jgi:hypothetical protein
MTDSKETPGRRYRRRADSAAGDVPGGLRGARVRAARGAARTAAVVALSATACAALVGVAAAGATAGARPARAVRVMEVKDEGHLHLASKPSGSLIDEEGSVAGTLPGTVKVRFNVGATVSAQFTIYARGGGSISGHGSGALHSTGEYSTFGGSLSVTSGTGRFAGAHGGGGLYGAINRKTYALTVQTLGKLSY